MNGVSSAVTTSFAEEIPKDRDRRISEFVVSIEMEAPPSGLLLSTKRTEYPSSRGVATTEKSLFEPGLNKSPDESVAAEPAT